MVLISAAAVSAQVNPRELVRQSIENGEKSWRASFDYSCTKNDVTKQLDSSGKVRHVDDDVYDVIALGYGSLYEEQVKHDNEPVSRAELAKQQQELARRRAESPAQKRRRFAKEIEERAYMREVMAAFDFRITGEENLPTGPAWVVEATPHPGYRPKSRYAHMFPVMRGKLWIDKKDVQWVKADAVATESISFGVFIARLAKGSHIIIEQMKLPDGAWVPKRIDAKASATTYLVFHHRFEEDITFSGYHKVQAPPASSAAAALE